MTKTATSRGRRKLTDEQVLNAVAEWRGGKKRYRIAKELKVAFGTIAAIVEGRTYSWLTGIAAAA